MGRCIDGDRVCNRPGESIAKRVRHSRVCDVERRKNPGFSRHVEPFQFPVDRENVEAVGLASCNVPLLTVVVPTNVFDPLNVNMPLPFITKLNAPAAP